MRFIAAILLASLPAAAQELQAIDLSATQGKQVFYVVFAARGGSSTGHAFVVWGAEDNISRRSTIEARGLYPDADQADCNLLVRTVSGHLMDEMATHSVQDITYALIVRVDEADYRRSRKVARAWDCRHEFSRLSRDCVAFLEAVGDSLHLDMPSRNLARITPQAYVRVLIERAAQGALAVNWWRMTAGW